MFFDANGIYLNSLQMQVDQDIKSVKEKVLSWIPEWTKETIMEEKVENSLLQNKNYNMLGAASNKLFQLLEAYKKMMKADRCPGFVATDDLKAAVIAKETELWKLELFTPSGAPPACVFHFDVSKTIITKRFKNIFSAFVLNMEMDT